MKAKGSLTKQEAEVEVSKDEINAFFNGIVPEFVKEGGGIISDTVRFWKWKNQIKLIKKAEKIIEDNNLTKQQIPLKVLAPLIENSSYEEDESMQNRWANLLSNCQVPNSLTLPQFVFNRHPRGCGDPIKNELRLLIRFRLRRNDILATKWGNVSPILW